MTTVPIGWDDIDEPSEHEARQPVCSNWWNDVKNRVKGRNLRDLDGDWSIQDTTYAYDTTLLKVREALRRVHFTENQIDESINEMLNAGILFRERKH